MAAIFYEEIVEIDAAEIAGLECDKTYENSLMKLNLFYEHELYSLVDYFEYDALLIINRKHILEYNNENFLYFARFYTTMLKYSFIFLVNKIQNEQKTIFPITLEQVIQYACEIRERLTVLVMETEKMQNCYDTMMLLTSFFDLHCAFTIRPIVIENSSKILQISQPKMEPTVFRKLVNLLETSIESNCEIGSALKEHFKFNDSNFNVELIDAFTNFLKSYHHLPSIIQVFKILSHYGDVDFEGSIYSLLKFIQYKKNFHQIIGFCIMNFVVMKKNNADFSVFAHAINNFLINEERVDIKVKVVEFVLNNLPTFMKKIQTHDNRMRIFKFLSIFMKKYSKKDEAIKICNLAAKITSQFCLKKNEAIAVENFIKSTV